MNVHVQLGRHRSEPDGRAAFWFPATPRGGMVLRRIFERFVEESSIRVMTRGVMQSALAAPAIDAVFEETSERQGGRERVAAEAN